MISITLRTVALVVALVMGGPASAQDTGRLDLGRLESRLRNSEAIDWLQKVRLSADVEELKARIDARRRDRAALDDLEGHFDRLFQAVLAMLRDTDPRLHHDMLASRNHIWSALSQPKRASGS